MSDAMDVMASYAELELGDSEYPDLTFMLDYWRMKRGNRLAPSRSDIDPADFKQILPQIMLADVLGQPPRFRYRLCGTGFRFMHGEELTHLHADELQPGEFGALIHNRYMKVLAEKRPLQHRIQLQSNYQTYSYAHLLLPLSSDGTVIDMLLIVDGSNRNVRELCEFFEKTRVTQRKQPA